MKHQWLAYVIVGLLSIGAGVAIAGLPDNAPVAATIPRRVDHRGARPSTVSDTTVPPHHPSPRPPSPNHGAGDHRAGHHRAGHHGAGCRRCRTSTSPDTTDSVPAELPDRSELNVAAANGANVGGAASRVAAQLEEIGYVDVLPLNGTDIFEFTTIYFAEGFDEAALRLAADLDVLDDFVAPIEYMPAVADLPADIDLVAYIGIDRA